MRSKTHLFVPPASPVYPPTASQSAASPANPQLQNRRRFVHLQPQRQSPPSAAANRQHQDSVSASDYYSDNEPPPPSPAHFRIGANKSQPQQQPQQQQSRLNVVSPPSRFPPRQKLLQRRRIVTKSSRKNDEDDANDANDGDGDGDVDGDDDEDEADYDDDDDAAAAARQPDCINTTSPSSESVHTARYRQAVSLIAERCAALSADNERLVHRLHYVKRCSKRKDRDVAVLKRRLDLYNDGWRTAQPEPLFKADMPTLIPANNNVIVRKKYKKREKTAAAEAAAAAAAEAAEADASAAIKKEECGDEKPKPKIELIDVRLEKQQQQHHQPQQQHLLMHSLPEFKAEPATTFQSNLLTTLPAAEMATSRTVVMFNNKRIGSHIDKPPINEHRYPPTSTPAPLNTVQSTATTTLTTATPMAAAESAPFVDVFSPSVLTPPPSQQAHQLSFSNPTSTAATVVCDTVASAGGPKPMPKQRKQRSEKDPNAPKRPANPFFQFCQEQRSILMGELNRVLLPGEPELSKQELTRQLAMRWRSLDANSKQIYNEMYEQSKQKYHVEMQVYRDGGGGAAHRAALGAVKAAKKCQQPQQQLQMQN